MNKPLVSIIVPFYNPEVYFDQLLESLSKQSYENIEIVLVDDGSDNNYNNTAKQFVSLAENRVLITKKNGGVASARQAGLEVSTGELIIHADADDLVPEFAIERLVEKMVATNADVVVGGYVVRYAKKESYIGVSEDESYWGFVEGLLLGKYHGSLWNKLIKRSLYSAVSFEPGLNYMEDKLMLAKIFSSGPYIISYLDETVYVYRQNTGSVTYNLSLESIKSSVAVVEKIADLYRGILDDQLIDMMVNKHRVFEIIQSAKKGLNIFNSKDSDLIKDLRVPFKFRVELFLIRIKLIFIVNLISKIKVALHRIVY